MSGNRHSRESCHTHENWDQYYRIITKCMDAGFHRCDNFFYESVKLKKVFIFFPNEMNGSTDTCENKSASQADEAEPVDGYILIWAVSVIK